MNNNDVFRRVCHVFNLNDKRMMKIFALADLKVDREQVCNWRKKDEDIQFENLGGKDLAIFLNGFINYKRGKKDGPQPQPEKFVNNNIVFRKLKIALDLKAEDVIEILELAKYKISKPELSSFFRKSDHKHYRECKDQILRNFLKGLQVREEMKKKDKEE